MMVGSGFWAGLEAADDLALVVRSTLGGVWQVDFELEVELKMP